MILYFVAVFEKLDTYGPVNSSCLGYFTSFEEAEYNVLNNVNDLYERCYNYAVIEDVKPGLWSSILSTPTFYKWDGKKYVRIDRPKETSGLCSFTLN